MMTLPVEYFCRFQPCNGYMWFRGSDINLLLSNRSEMWSNAKIKNLQIFSVVFKSFDSFISVSNSITRIVVNYRSSLQS